MSDIVDVEKKKNTELEFWQGWLGKHGIGARTAYYRDFMLKMGGIDNVSFFDDLVCLDIGCGPMGSLTWLPNARLAIGLDTLADDYMEFGIDRHEMLYLKSGAESIPLPSWYVDVVFSMNSLDHVDNLAASCREIRRVLKPNGYFIGSLNLNIPPTPAEPWTLTEELLHKILFAGWQREFYRVRPKAQDGDPYRYFFEDCPPELEKVEGQKTLWCRFRAV